MDTKRLYVQLKKEWPIVKFSYEKGSTRDDDTIYASFVRVGAPFRFIVEIRIINDRSLYVRFFFDKILDFNKALFLVNELNMHTSACFKASLRFEKDGYYLFLDYYTGVYNEEEAKISFDGAIRFLASNEMKTYLTPLYKLTRLSKLFEFYFNN